MFKIKEKALKNKSTLIFYAFLWGFVGFRGGGPIIRQNGTGGGGRGHFLGGGWRGRRMGEALF